MPASRSGSFPDSLEQAIGHTFRNRDLPLEALTHRTYAHENPQAGPVFNERLEFLGDSVLGVLISEELFRLCPDWDEGRLSKMKASLVRDTTLARVATALNLGRLLRLGRGEAQTGGRTRVSLLAAAVEAVLAAVYLDGGLEDARKVVRKVFGETIRESIEGGGIEDFKTALQEHCHRQTMTPPRYVVVQEEGPDHNKTFRIEVWSDDRLLGRGEGKSKKEAEQIAARSALEGLK